MFFGTRCRELINVQAQDEALVVSVCCQITIERTSCISTDNWHEVIVEIEKTFGRSVSNVHSERQLD
jgi:hypothetical protein